MTTRGFELSAIRRNLSVSGLAAFTIASAAVLLVPACKDSKSSQSGSASAAETGEKGDGERAKAPPSQRSKLESFRPLIDEAARAELDVGGLLVDFGTADQHKYTRGGWRTGWGESKLDGATSLAVVEDRKADLSILVSDGPVAEVVVRGRSKAAGQVLTVYVDGTRIGDGKLEADWTTIRVAATGLEPGVHDVDLVFAKGGEPRAELDWLWLAREAGAAEPGLVPRVLPVRIGERPKRSLIAPGSRSYSFYMQPGDGQKLVFEYGSDKGATFSVVATADGGEPAELWSGKGTGAWQEAVVDLAPVAGKAVRLELATDGPEGVAGWGEPEIMTAPTEPESGSAKPKNVIVILVDTVRADTFAAFAPDNKVVTPVYDELAKTSTVFTHAYTQENWTKPSVATVLSGIYPSIHDTKTDGARLPDDVELLSQRLEAEGFKTAGFVANGYVSDKFGFEKGWDVFKNYIREAIPSEAEHVYGDALAWLTENKDEPFFLYLQTIDPHVVYRVDEEFTKHYFEGEYKGPLGPTVAAEEQIALGKGSLKASERDIAWLKALYWGEVTYHDTEMGKFFAKLDEMGVTDETLIVITNDHGEELGDHGKYGHGHTLFDELIRAPLLFHFPGMFPAESRDEIVENVDLAPTVVDALGVKPLAKADGMSLLPLVRGEPVQRPYYSISEFLDGRRASRVGDYKIILSAGTYLALYDIKSDPGETKDLAKERPIARRMVEVTMGEGLATPQKSQRLEDMTTKRQFKAGQADIDPEMRKQLEALGYFGE